jgi:hypothetical protein
MVTPTTHERRKSILTREDLEAIAAIIIEQNSVMLANSHPCQFTPDDILAVKEVAGIFTKLKGKVLDSIYTLILTLLIGLIVLISTHGLWKTK